MTAFSTQRFMSTSLTNATINFVLEVSCNVSWHIPICLYGNEYNLVHSQVLIVIYIDILPYIILLFINKYHDNSKVKIIKKKIYHYFVAEFTKPQAKVTRVLFVQARSSPAGVVEKSSSPRGACGIFPHNLAWREHDLLEPVVWELRPRIAGLTRNIIMLCHKQY